MPRLLIDGTALSARPKGVGRYSFQLIDRITRRLGERWCVDVMVGEDGAPTFAGPLQPRLIRVPHLSDLGRGLVVAPLLALARQADCILLPMDNAVFAAGKPVVTVVHDIPELIAAAGGEGMGAARRALERVKRVALTSTLRRADVVVCNSQFTARETIERYGVDPAAVRIGYCGIDSRFYEADDADAAAIWPRLGAWDGYVLTFATGDPRERFDLCPQVWQHVCVHKGKVGLVVAGVDESAPYAGRMRAAFAAQSLREGDHYMFLPFLAESEFDRLRALYRSADFYLELSGHEGFGMQLAEAMATGTTCISSGRAALAEVGGPYAVRFDSFEPAGIAATILDSYAAGLHVRDNRAQVDYTSRFDWDAVGNLVVDEINRLV